MSTHDWVHKKQKEDLKLEGMEPRKLREEREDGCKKDTLETSITFSKNKLIN